MNERVERELERRSGDVGMDERELERRSGDVNMDSCSSDGGGVTVSLFEDSAEKFFESMETIGSLCGVATDEQAFDPSEIQRFSSMITFPIEWKSFCYGPKDVNFSFEAEPPQVEQVIGGINLPQFSSAAIHKREQPCGRTKFLNSKDFVLHAGGSVWALDWRPRNNESFDHHITCEYLAVAAHPSDSSYHKLGVALTGRGIVQIWCVLHMVEEGKSSSPGPGGRAKKGSSSKLSKEKSCSLRPRGRPRKNPVNLESSDPPRPSGRPRKNPVIMGSLDGHGECKLSPPRKRGRPRKKILRTESLDCSDVKKESSQVKRPRGRPRKRPEKIENVDDSNIVEDLSITKFVPASVTELKEDSSISLSINELIGRESFSQKRPRGRPRKKPDRKENIEDLNAVEDLIMTKFVTAPVLELQEDASVLPIINGYITSKSSPPKRPRGRPKKKPGVKKNLDNLNAFEDLSTTKLVPAFAVEVGEDASTLPSINELITSRSSLLRGFEMDESPKLDTLGDLYGEDKQSPPRWRGGRSGKKPVVKECLDGELALKTLTELNSAENKSPSKQRVGRPRERTGRASADINGEDKSSPTMWSRGRHTKGSVESDSLNDSNGAIDSNINMYVGLGQDASVLPSMSELVKTNSGNAVLRRCDKDEMFATPSGKITCTQKRRKKAKVIVVADQNSSHQTQSTNIEDLSIKLMQAHGKQVQDAMVSSPQVAQKRSPGVNAISSLQKDIALPKVVLCLAHNGKVAWDVKWRPPNIGNLEFKHHMGYLAVLLGNGSLEVWDIPLPNMVKILYTSCDREITDPRFLKLNPVFRCSKVKCGDRQSIPLTVEWSRSAPCDFILAGCHDGTVALWKFSAHSSFQDTKPLLCFTADSFPIRAVAWAPNGSDAESTNLIVTAGHEGLKFWDIRDPYRPLWDFSPAQRFILSLDWLQDPRCLIISFDDGSMKTLSLWRAANDAPVTGIPFSGSRHGVLRNYYCSQFAIWSVQVSQVTGVSAYCSADGSTHCFQITVEAVEKDKSRRHSSPLFLCGMLVEADQTLTIHTPLPDTVVAGLPRPSRGQPSDPKHAKKGNSQVPGDDYAIVLGSENCRPDPWRRTTPGTKLSQNDKLTDQQQTVHPLCIVGGEEQNLNARVGNQRPDDQNILTVLPKIVAIHKVRWNVNKGSERWLCYGGAAGIIRCQEIALP